MSFEVLGYGRQCINDDDINEVIKILKGDWLTMGPAVKNFEGALADYAGVKHAVTFSSGTAALHGAMFAAGLGEGDYSLTTALTFVATANSALYTGAVPLFADIDKDTLCLNPDLAEEIINANKNKNIKAIVPVSFAGYPFDIAPFKKLAEKIGAVLIEDASHSLGGDRGNKKIGADADMTTLSFHPVKHITTAEGGAVLTNNDKFAKTLRLFRNHGVVREASEFLETPDGDWHSEMQFLGYNYRLSDLNSALGLSQMKRLNYFVQRRREIADLYRELLKPLELDDKIILPAHKTGHAYHLFLIQVKNNLRGKLFAHLKNNNIRLQVHYMPVPLQPYYKKRFNYKKGGFPNAELYYQQAISLPIFPDMDNSDIERVVNCIKEFFSKI